jgi:heptaprenyl diphosphate synthase
MTASHPDTAGSVRSRRIDAATLSRLGLLAAAAVAVYVFEGVLPMPLPWARLGLSNAVTVVVLFSFGFGSALAVNVVRIVAGNLLLGMMLSPAFLFSAAGSTAALLAMGLVRWKMVPPLSIVGASVVGAVVNNAVQVTIFTGLFARSSVSGNLLGIFLLLGLAVGLLTGFVAAAVAAKVGLASRRALG